MRKIIHLRNTLKVVSIILITFLTGCSKKASDSINPDASGSGGSMARFAISRDNLYTVNGNSMNLFDVTDANDPSLLTNIPLAVGIETIFPRDSALFIGSQSGMFIFDISSPSAPTLLSTYSHIFSCDPVVADDKYAYVTLRSGNTCGRKVNQLEIVDIQNLQIPFQVKSYTMDKPFGLGIDNHDLFICDNGLKVYDASDVNNLVLKNHFNINAFDVIPNNGNLMVIGEDGLYQYDYSGSSLNFLSKLKIIPLD